MWKHWRNWRFKIKRIFLDFKRLRKQKVKQLLLYTGAAYKIWEEQTLQEDKIKIGNKYTHFKSISAKKLRQSSSKEGNHYKYFRMLSKERKKVWYKFTLFSRRYTPKWTAKRKICRSTKRKMDKDQETSCRDQILSRLIWKLKKQLNYFKFWWYKSMQNNYRERLLNDHSGQNGWMVTNSQCSSENGNLKKKEREAYHNNWK